MNPGHLEPHPWSRSMGTCALALSLLLTPVQEASALDPLIERAPIFYSQTEPDTAITRIIDQLERGELQLKGTTDQEIVEEFLAWLDIPVESQVLVFSKTSAQNAHISPKTPRAIYFSDNAYLGWSVNGDIETVTYDARLGAIFHLVKIKNLKPQEIPKLVRDQSCLSCHGGSTTSGFPGVLVRSIYPGDTGHPYFQAGTFLTTSSSPLSERWGGWYVTGDPGQQKHMGNSIGTLGPGRKVTLKPMAEGPLHDLEPLLPGTSYPAGHVSDIVALMVLEHQVMLHNLMVEASIRIRQQEYQQEKMTEALGEGPQATSSQLLQRLLESHSKKIVDALLYKDEFVMHGDGVEGSEAFQTAFAQNAKTDSKGRSLKDFRLYERIFRNRCSYMIYSEVFDHMPDSLKKQVLSDLRTVLKGTDTEEYPHLATSERTRIDEILSDTYPGWKDME